MAISGSLNTSAYEGRYLQLSWSRTGYDIAANPATSTVHWVLKGAGSASSSYYVSGPFTVIIDGQTVYSGGGRIQLYDGTTVASGDITIAHNTDGTRSFSTSVSAAIFSSSQNVSGSGSFDLDALPRASSISCDPLTMGTAGTITVASASPDFVHTVQYQFGGASGTIGYLTGSGTLMWNPSIDLAEQIPNSAYAAATLTCITYTGEGGSEIGRKSISVDLYTPASMVPTISACTISPVNTNGWLTPKNAYAAGWTKARVQTTAAGVKGSTIRSIVITGIGAGGGADWTSGLLDAGAKTITITATDSRGRTASTTRSITVLAYTPPVIAGLTYARGSYAGGVWTTADSGTDVKVTFTLGLSLLDLENAAKLTVSLTDKTTQGPAWHGAGTWTYYFTAIGTDVSRKLTVLAEDGTGTQSTLSIDVSTINVPININFDINGIRIGGIAEDPDTFRMSWKAKFDGSTKIGDTDIYGITDFVVEQGTSGIWTYRKWASGAFECWGTWTGTLTAYYTSEKYGQCYYKSIDLPFTLAAAPMFTFVAQIGDYFSIPSSFKATTSSITCYASSDDTTTGAKSCKFNIDVKGRWK